MSHKLFVYGTLRRGERLHRALAGAKFIGVAKTSPSFTMFNLGWFPCIVADGKTEIIGEVYEIGDEHLHRIDGIEGYCKGSKHNLYMRETIDVTLLDLEERTQVYVYVMTKKSNEEDIIESGDWLHK